MASGVNSTFRQIGIAVSIAVQGSIFAAFLGHGISRALAGHPSLADKSTQIATAVRQGTVPKAFATVPPSDRGLVRHAIEASFTGGLNDLFYITAGIAFVGAVGSFLLIRARDFDPAAGGRGVQDQPALVSEAVV